MKRQESAARLVRTLISLLEELEVLFLEPGPTEEVQEKNHFEHRPAKKLKTTHKKKTVSSPLSHNARKHQHFSPATSNMATATTTNNSCSSSSSASQSSSSNSDKEGAGATKISSSLVQKGKKTSTEGGSSEEGNSPGGGINEVHMRLMETANQLIDKKIKLNREHLKEAGFRITLFKHYPELTHLFREMKKKYNPQLKAQQQSLQQQHRMVAGGHHHTDTLGTSSNKKNNNQIHIRVANEGPPKSMLPAAERVQEVPPNSSSSQRQSQNMMMGHENNFKMDSTGLVFTLPDNFGS